MSVERCAAVAGLGQANIKPQRAQQALIVAKSRIQLHAFNDRSQFVALFF